MAITMAKLARMAELSPSAVSLIINGKANGHIAKAKQQRVMELVKLHNYRPNTFAQKLRSPKVYTIGIVMPIPKTTFDVTILARLQIGFARCGYTVLFSFWKDVESISEAFASIVAHHVDGVISWEYDACLENEKLPALLYSIRHTGFDSICLNWEEAVRRGLQYLRDLGHRRIGFIGYFADPRYDAFLRGMEEFGLIRVPGCEQPCVGIQEEAIPATRRLLMQPELPDAVIAMNDAIAQGIYYAATEAGLNIPNDLSVLGFDDSVGMRYMFPPLTTFSLRPEDLADHMIQRMMLRLDNPELASEEMEYALGELVERQSCRKLP